MEKKKILIVDDEAEIRSLTEKYMQRQGYFTDTACDGEEALLKFKKENPDLVLLDIGLPKIDGIAVCRSIKSSKDFIPVIFITGKFTEVSDKVEGLKAGADDYLVKPFDLAELDARIRAMFRLKAMHDELKTLNKRLEELSVADPLTGVYNRRHLIDMIEIEIKRSHRTGSHFACMIIDLDNFKPLNDSYGHAFGDAVLRQLGDFFKKNVRQTDIVARYGGDEFFIVAPDTDRNGASILAEKLLKKLKETVFKKDDLEILLGMSIGISLFEGSSVKSGYIDSPALNRITDQLINDADKELYKAKGNKRS